MCVQAFVIILDSGAFRIFDVDLAIDRGCFFPVACGAELYSDGAGHFPLDESIRELSEARLLLPPLLRSRFLRSVIIQLVSQVDTCTAE